MSLNKLTLIAATVAAAEYVFVLPPNFPNSLVLQLTTEPSAALPHLPSDQWVEVSYGTAEGLAEGPGGTGPIGEPGGEQNPANWAPWHPFARMGAYGQGDGPRVVLEPGGYFRVRKPATSDPVGVEAIGFDSQIETRI
jgi:hypothetical protein